MPALRCDEMYWNRQSSARHQIGRYPLTQLLSYPDIDSLFIPEIGLTYDASGLISKWSDVSNRRALTQSNVGLRPSLTTFWNRPAVNFAGGKWIRTQVGPVPQPYTVYVVAKFPGGTNQIMLDNGTSIPAGNPLWYEFTYSRSIELGGYELPSNLPDITNAVVIGVANGASSVISVNNVNPSNTGTTTISAAAGIIIGARRSTDSSYFNGIAGPVAYFKSAHTPAVRKRIALLMSSYYSMPILA